MKIRIKANDGYWRAKLTEALAEMGYTVSSDIYDRSDYYVELDGPEGDITIPIDKSMERG